jgi:hypothetical protein
VSDLSDFMAAWPTPSPPPPAKVYGEPPATRGSLQMEVSTNPCKVGRCPHPDGHHAGPYFEPDPELDESLVGWTPQHVRRRPVEPVKYRCILCWEEAPELVLHDCRVLALWREVGSSSTPAPA